MAEPADPKQGKNTVEEDLQRIDDFKTYIEKHEDLRKRNLPVRPGRHPQTRPTVQDDNKPPSPEQIAVMLDAASDSNLRDVNLLLIRIAGMQRWIFQRQDDADGRIVGLQEREKLVPNRRELLIVLGGMLVVGLIVGFVVGRAIAP